MLSRHPGGSSLMAMLVALLPLAPAAARDDKETVRQLIRQLEEDGEDLFAPLRAASALHLMGPEAKAAVPALLKALRDPFAGPTAARALLAIDPDNKQLVPQLLEDLSGLSAGARATAAQSLAVLGPKALPAVPALVRVLRADSETQARASAAQALGAIGPAARSAVPALVRALRDRDRNVRVMAACALADIDPSSTRGLPILLGTLTGGSPLDYVQPLLPLAREAFIPLLIGTISPNLSETLLLCRLELGVVQIQTAMEMNAALFALQRLGASARPALPLLRRLRRHPDPVVRSSAELVVVGIEAGDDPTGGP